MLAVGGRLPQRDEKSIASFAHRLARCLRWIKELSSLRAVDISPESGGIPPTLTSASAQSQNIDVTHRHATCGLIVVPLLRLLLYHSLNCCDPMLPKLEEKCRQTAAQYLWRLLLFCLQNDPPTKCTFLSWQLTCKFLPFTAGQRDKVCTEFLQDFESQCNRN